MTRSEFSIVWLNHQNKSITLKINSLRQYFHVRPHFTFKHYILLFLGDRVRYRPHIQTGGGKVFYKVLDAYKAVDSLQFDGRDTTDNGWYDHLEYASRMIEGDTTNIFILFNDDATVSNSLMRMLQVYESLSTKSVKLNVVSRYKMKRSKCLFLLHCWKYLSLRSPILCHFIFQVFGEKRKCSFHYLSSRLCQ